MKANELRVENLVWACGDAAKIVTIDEGFCKVQFLVDIESRPIISVIDLGHIEPIPLTEEWLKDFGFDNDLGYDKNNLELRRDKTGYYEYSLRLQGLGVYIEYVHQLQNLYFALTGEELTINK